MDEKSRRRLEAKKILYDLYRTDFQIFVLVSFVFSLNFSLILICKCMKPIQKALFSRFRLSEIIGGPFTSLMAKSDVCNVFDSRIICRMICESMLSTNAEITPALLPW